MHKESVLKRVIIAGAIGIGFTFALLACAIAADNAGYPEIVRIVFWQNELLQSLTPLSNMGAEENPVYEGTPLNDLAFYASIPLGFVIYGSMAHRVLHIKH